jgi:hypothetical protein
MLQGNAAVPDCTALRAIALPFLAPYCRKRRPQQQPRAAPAPARRNRPAPRRPLPPRPQSGASFLQALPGLTMPAGHAAASAPPATDLEELTDREVEQAYIAAEEERLQVGVGCGGCGAGLG